MFDIEDFFSLKLSDLRKISSLQCFGTKKIGSFVVNYGCSKC